MLTARIVPRGQNGCSTYARIVSQEKTRKSPDLGRATSVQYYTMWNSMRLEWRVRGCALYSLELAAVEGRNGAST